MRASVCVPVCVWRGRAYVPRILHRRDGPFHLRTAGGTGLSDVLLEWASTTPITTLSSDSRLHASAVDGDTPPGEARALSARLEAGSEPARPSKARQIVLRRAPACQRPTRCARCCWPARSRKTEKTQPGCLRRACHTASPRCACILPLALVIPGAGLRRTEHSWPAICLRCSGALAGLLITALAHWRSSVGRPDRCPHRPASAPWSALSPHRSRQPRPAQNLQNECMRALTTQFPWPRTRSVRSAVCIMRPAAGVNRLLHPGRGYVLSTARNLGSGGHGGPGLGFCWLGAGSCGGSLSIGEGRPGMPQTLGSAGRQVPARPDQTRCLRTCEPTISRPHGRAYVLALMLSELPDALASSPSAGSVADIEECSRRDAESWRCHSAEATRTPRGAGRPQNSRRTRRPVGTGPQNAERSIALHRCCAGRSSMLRSRTPAPWRAVARCPNMAAVAAGR